MGREGGARMSRVDLSRPFIRKERRCPAAPAGTAAPLGGAVSPPSRRAVPVGKEAVQWRRRSPQRSPCWGRPPARPAALTVSRAPWHLPSSLCSAPAALPARAALQQALRRPCSVKQSCGCFLCYRILAFVPRSRTSVCEDQPRKRGRTKVLCLFGL